MVESAGPALTLVIGGAASGKSCFAEALARDTGLPRYYLATAQAHDAEMAAKIETHRNQRGDAWTTLETPQDLPDVLGTLPADHVVLIDCLTLWLSNRLLAGADCARDREALCSALAACASPVVAVTNEVGQGIVPETALGRQFRTLQGVLNQSVAAQANRVALVVAGLPLWLKGGA